MSIVKIPEHQLDLTNTTARIDTAQKDLADLGDQVSNIESKIPNDASETNPLATKGQVEAVSSDLTDLENKTAEIESKIPETATSTNKLVDAEFLASELAKKQDTGDYATKTDVNNLADDLATVTNQVGEQGEAINGLNSVVTNLSNNKADKSDSLFGYGITDAYTKEEVNGLVSSAFHYKGSKASVLELPEEGNIIGDVWNVLDTGANYAWTGTEWDKLSETVDLSGYYTKDEVNNNFSTKSDVNAHIANTKNPHNVTKSQIGLGNVDNTADVDKPISTLQQSALDLKADKSDTYTKTEVDNQLSTKATKTDLTNYLPLTGGTLSGDLKVKGNKVLDTSDKAVANGVASLDAKAKLHAAQIPVATASTLGGVKVDGTTINATSDGTISATQQDLSGYAKKADLGTMASKSAYDYSTTVQANSLYAAKGLENTVSTLSTTVAEKANTADLAAVATSGSYNDLRNKPTIPDTSNLATKTELDNYIPTSQKGTASGVATLGTDGKVPTSQLPEMGSGSGFDFEGTKEEFDAAVAAGTITEDSVSLITDDVSGDTVVTKADLAVALNERADKQLSNTNLITNCILSAPNGVVQVSSTDPYTLVVNKGLKVALSNGYNADRTPKSEIITLDNDISITIPSTTNYNWPIYVILAKPISDGAFRIIIPNKSDFESVKVIPSNIQTDLYKVYYNLDTNTFYEHQIGGSLSEYKGVLLGFGKFVDSKFTDMIPYKPIQLSLEGIGDYVVEFQVNSDGSWYRKYKSGWLEQGGFGKGSIVFSKPYTVSPNMNVTSANTTGDGWPARANSVTTTGFYLYGGNNDSVSAYWEAKGMGAN